jgi:acetyl-CoA carboxylase biotin carboxyl carrier protein
MATRNIKSMIAGTVLQVHKRPGDPVAARDAVVSLECMKMEIPIAAPAAGRIVSIEVNQGDNVAQDQLVFVLET